MSTPASSQEDAPAPEGAAPSRDASSEDAPSASSEEDRRLVEAALGGDEGAYQQLVEKYERALYYYLKRMVREERVLDDLVQESFIKAFEALDSYDPQYAFSTWLYRIAKNHTIDHLRKRKLPTRSIDRPRPSGGSGSDEGSERPFQLPDEHGYRPDEHIVQSQRENIVQDAIDALPKKYRRVIELRHQQERSYKEIAEELDKPLGTVKAHLYRARERLNKRLRDKRGAL
jgi:RNA polymerase sigma-70 factor (ECF subfamily)